MASSELSRPGTRPARRWRPRVEALEDRAVLSSACGCGNPDLLTGHVDGIALDFLDGAWVATTEDKDNGVRYDAGAVNLVAVPGTRIARPAASTFDFLGVPAGADVWVLRQNQLSDQLYLGSNSERTASGTLATYFESDPRVNGTDAWIRVQVVDVRGPGQFSMWQAGFFGGITTFVSTADGLTADDAFFLSEGSHTHYNWGFTARGYYEIDVRASAFLGPDQTDPTTSPVFTYRFSVERPGCLRFESAEYTVTEAGAFATITVTRTNGSDGTVTVDYATADGTADGADYTPTSGTLTFLDGETTKTFTVPVAADGLTESPETVNLVLSNPGGGARLGAQGTAVLSILDEGTSPPPPPPPPPPAPLAMVDSVTVNDGSAQRSAVTSLTVTFSTAVTIDDGAFEVSAGSVAVATSDVDGRTVAVLTFTGSDVVAGSPPDGNYTLTVRADRVRDALGRDLDGDADGAAGGNRTEAFFRYFGDADGDRDVDDADATLFQTTLGRSAGEAEFLPFFDANGDGVVDEATDLAEFLLRFGTALSP